MSYVEEPAVVFRCSLSAASRAARASIEGTREFPVGFGQYLPHHKKGI